MELVEYSSIEGLLSWFASEFFCSILLSSSQIQNDINLSIIV